MSMKTYISDGAEPSSQIGASIDALFTTIESRGSHADSSESYTKALLDGPLDKLLKKVSEESLETCLAAKECQMTAEDPCALDANVDHMRYEAADVVYHLLVLLHRFGISADELAAELNCRMTPDELPEGCVMLFPEHVRRGK